MKLTCDVETTYTLAQASGGALSKGTRTRASLSLGKKPAGGGARGSKEEELFLVVSTLKNVTGIRYKVHKQSVCYCTVSRDL